MNTPPDVMGAALGYIALGYPVLPLRPASKLPLPANGLKGATLEVETVSRWLRAYPNANLGILPPANVLVLDFDEPGAFIALVEEHPELNTAPIAATGGGGFHLWLSLPENNQLAAKVRALPGVDLRGMGRAYLVAPPSTHPTTGRGYEWLAPLEAPAHLPICPPALLARITPQKSAPLPAATTTSTPAPAGLIAWAVAPVAKAPEGQRHSTLLARARLLGGWLHNGITEGEALEALVHAGVQAGLPQAEAERTARDGLRYGQAAPLEAPAPRAKMAMARKQRRLGVRP